MDIRRIPFVITEWKDVATTEHPGDVGKAIWQTQQFGDIRVRIVECTPGYVSDHWCVKGHILYCLDGELRTELNDGRTFTLRRGMSFQVADNAEAHRSSTIVGARLLIVD